MSMSLHNCLQTVRRCLPRNPGGYQSPVTLGRRGGTKRRGICRQPSPPKTSVETSLCLHQGRLQNANMGKIKRDSCPISLGKAAPVAVADSSSTDEATATTISVLNNDSDADGDSLTITNVDTTGTQGTVTIDGGSTTVTYNPNGAFDSLQTGGSATDTFTYTADDGNGGTATAQVTVTINGISSTPTVVADTATTDEATQLSAIAVLSNDSDGDGDSLTVSAVDTTGTQGTVTIDGGSTTVTYNPNGAFDSLQTGSSATDTFTYTADDGNGGTATAQVTVTINGVSSTPTVVADTATTDEATQLSAIAVLSNDSDGDGDTLTISAVDTTGTQGTVTIDGGSTTVTYNPNGAFDSLQTGSSATDTFTYTADDGNGGTATAQVTVTINGVSSTPTVVADTATTDEATQLSAIAVLSNDSDGDGDSLTVSAVDTATHGTQGTVTSDPESTTVTYNPNGAFDSLHTSDTGTDTFAYTASDGNGGTATSQVTITINGVSSTPVASADTGTTDEQTALSALAVLSNDSDGDGDALSVSAIDTTGTQGSVSIDGGSTTVTYNPNGAFNSMHTGDTQTDTFTYTVTDGGGGNGGTATATVTITINGISTADAVDDTATTDESTALASIAVLTNDQDIEGDSLTVASVDTTGTQGTVSINAGSTTLSYNPNGAFATLHDSDTGTDTFTYTVDDGFSGSDTATVTVTVTGISSTPVAVDDSATTDEASTTTINVLTNDSDGDSDTLTIASVDDTGVQGTVTIGGGSTSLTYNPNGQFHTLLDGQTATETFTCTVTDGGNGNGGTATATVTVTVTGISTANAVDDTASTTEAASTQISVLNNDSDVEGDTLTVASVDTATHSTQGTVTIDAGSLTVTYNPNGAFDTLHDSDTGTDTFAYTVDDGFSGSDTAVVTVTVTGISSTPVAVADSATTDEATTLTAVAVLSNDSDGDSDTLTISAIDTATHTTKGSVSIDGGSTTITYNPNNQFYLMHTGEQQTDKFDYTVTDGGNGNGGTATATVTITINGISTANAVDDTASTTEAASTQISVLNNDSDVEGDTLTVGSVDTATHSTQGAVTIDAGSLTVTYNPNGAFDTLHDSDTGTDTFAYTVDDGFSGSDTAVVTVTVTGISSTPVAVDDAVTTDENTQTTISVLNNDSDGDSDTLTVTSVDTATHSTKGTVTIDGGSTTVTYNPNGQFATLRTGESQTDTFTYTISDGGNGNGGTATATVTVTVTGKCMLGEGMLFDWRNVWHIVCISTADAVDDSASTDENSQIVSMTVLSNDVDVEGDTLTVASVDTSTHSTQGTVTINAGSTTLLYDPNGQFHTLHTSDTGTDTFAYTVTDGNGGTDTAVVTVTVTGISSTPVAVADTTTTDEATQLVSIAVISNDSDGDSDTLTVDSIDTTGTQGTVTIDGGATTITYNPNGVFDSLHTSDTQTDTFTYTVTDGGGGNGGTATATVTITINGISSTPVGVADTATTDEATAATAIAVLSNDSDGDGDTLSVTALFSFDTLRQVDTTGTQGTVTIDAGSTTVTYNPNGAFDSLHTSDTGTDTFSYTVSDGGGGNGGTATATVTVTINGISSTPVAVDDAQTTDEATSLASMTVLSNDSDGDSDALTIASIDTTGTQGTVTIDGSTTTITYNPNGVFDSLHTSDTQTDTFTYTVTDGGGGNGGTATATVTITINGISSTPVGVADTATTDEATAAAAIAVLSNDSDGDGDTLSVTAVDTSSTQGTVTIDAGSTTVTYNPNGAFDSLHTSDTGTDTFSYTVSDGGGGNGGTATATVTVTINGISSTPVPVDDAQTTDEATSLASMTVLSNDSDGDSDALTIASIDTTGTQGTVTIDGSTTTITYNPNGVFDSLHTSDTQTDTFTYTVTDGGGGNGGTATATVTITINGISSTPVGVADTATTDEATAAAAIAVLSNDSDGDGDSLSLTAVDTSSTQGTVTIDAGSTTVTYNPNGAFDSLHTSDTGTDTFSYTVSDGGGGNGGTATATVTVTINGISSIPVAVDDAQTTDEATSLASMTVLGNDSDGDSDALTIASIDTTGTQGTVTIDGSTTTITYNPNGVFDSLHTSDTQTDTFTYTVTEGGGGNGGTATATVTITINGISSTPVGVADSATTDEVTSLPAIAVLANDSDGDGDALTVSAVDTSTTQGTVTIDAGSTTVTYNPNGAFDNLHTGDTGTDTFTYTLTDGGEGNGGTATATVTITVNGISSTPVAVDDSGTTDETSPLASLTVLSNDNDGDSDALTIASIDTTGTKGAVVIDVGSTTVTYSPNGAFDSMHTGDTQTDTFSYTLTDGGGGNGGTATATVTITINGVSSAPVAGEDSVTTDEDTSVTFNVLGNDSDGDGDALSVIGTDLGDTIGAVTDNGGGSFTYNPNGKFFGLLTGQTATDSFRYTLSDGGGGNGGTGIGTVTITVNGVTVPDETTLQVVQGIPVRRVDFYKEDQARDEVTITEDLKRRGQELTDVSARREFVKSFALLVLQEEPQGSIVQASELPFPTDVSDKVQQVAIFPSGTVVNSGEAGLDLETVDSSGKRVSGIFAPLNPGEWVTLQHKGESITVTFAGDGASFVSQVERGDKLEGVEGDTTTLNAADTNLGFSFTSVYGRVAIFVSDAVEIPTDDGLLRLELWSFILVILAGVAAGAGLLVLLLFLRSRCCPLCCSRGKPLVDGDAVKQIGKGTKGGGQIDDIRGEVHLEEGRGVGGKIVASTIHAGSRTPRGWSLKAKVKSSKETGEASGAEEPGSITDSVVREIVVDEEEGPFCPPSPRLPPQTTLRGLLLLSQEAQLSSATMGGQEDPDKGVPPGLPESTDPFPPFWMERPKPTRPSAPHQEVDAEWHGSLMSDHISGMTLGDTHREEEEEDAVSDDGVGPSALRQSPFFPRFSLSSSAERGWNASEPGTALLIGALAGSPPGEGTDQRRVLKPQLRPRPNRQSIPRSDSVGISPPTPTLSEHGNSVDVGDFGEEGGGNDYVISQFFRKSLFPEGGKQSGDPVGGDDRWERSEPGTEYLMEELRSSIAQEEQKGVKVKERETQIRGEQHIEQIDSELPALPTTTVEAPLGAESKIFLQKGQLQLAVGRKIGR
uniref:RapA2 cadherin-like domain-containing protein n=1 Tax=Chromera velia CCMP2878 TaxID=1169474 RepID=A0A0G4IAV8_9ALVE|eukprot:Cvel_12684.t1-p1 / transcript=Cvel_12684.t1 / gene=Cvel_12684 / organism=Chromera_velia_CCMP2878 / gene_product=Putative cell agglutination protein 1742.01, putative / transcript_product=Putative cell agglutination protein 1742.01, putative / location=Cvel_scaffold839:2714-22970(+) / protein_length=3080 / sequence_SO=supercontig / SO=protein_coding / is_pseudo=false